MKKSIIALMMMISLNAFAAGPTQECKDEAKRWFEDNARVLPNCNVIFFT